MNDIQNHSLGRLGQQLADSLEATYLKDDLIDRIKGLVERENSDHELMLSHTKFVQASGVCTAVVGALADRKEAHLVNEALLAHLQKLEFFSNEFEVQHFDQTLKDYEELIWDSKNFGSPLTPMLVGHKFAEKVGQKENETIQKFGMAFFVEQMRTNFQKLYTMPHGIRLNEVGS